MSDFVIKHWRYGAKPVDEQGNYVHIVGQIDGAGELLMLLLRLDPSVKLLVGLDRVEWRRPALTGSKIFMVPLEQLSASYYGYHKPVWSAVALAGVFTLLGVGAGLEMGWAAGLGLATVGWVLGLLRYLRGTRLVLGLVERSGRAREFRFPRCTLEGVDINEQQARQVNKVIQRLIDAKQKRMLVSVMGGGS